MKKPDLQELRNWLPDRPALVAWLAVIGVFLWTYQSSVLALFRAWEAPEYGHGYFVPVFAVFLLWYRRDMISRSSANQGSLWGLPFIGLWAVMRWTAVYFNYGSLPEMCLLPFLIGLTIFAGGWQALRWAWPAVGFLVFMIPLPGAIQGRLAHPLQKIGTYASVYVIQTLGIPAVSQGNTIVLTEKELGVVEACSGLRMLMLFFAICFGAAFVVRKPLWEKLVIVASAIPIAVVSNVARISLTAILCEIARQWPSIISMEQADEFFHGMAGLLMMPVALLILWAELAMISKLMIAPLSERPLVAQEGLTGVLREPGLARIPERRKRK